jgi:hypothetical protein
VLVVVVLERWMLRLIVYRKLEIRQIYQRRVKFSMLPRERVKPLSHGGADPTGPRAADMA